MRLGTSGQNVTVLNKETRNLGTGLEILWNWRDFNGRDFKKTAKELTDKAFIKVRWI